MLSILLFLILSESAHFFIMSVNSLFKFLSSLIHLKLKFSFGSLFLISHFILESSFLVLVPLLSLLHLTIVLVSRFLELFGVSVLLFLSFFNVLFLSPGLFVVKLSQLSLMLVVSGGQGIGVLSIHVLDLTEMRLLLSS